ncbi:hypothetical protein SAMN05421810_102868 [Amycolatopsis arida]|uniref:Uncharacterized protein n=2 Tax=Amycolatopsis arida TaxID=587909 RepID=A0A1I5R486_9PSEU|nr:hypothetical protein CLV69_101869 [Amycolatopsis arida]SFP53157.1 hypothetical protein SAMN05421810_102868 [Amycolatopsis arida]
MLNEAVRLVQTGNFGGLCEALGPKSNCEVHLQEARVAGLVPSKTRPEVVETIQVGVNEVSLRLQGNYADGRTYETEFHVVRIGGRLQATNPIYWLPIERAQADCKHEPEHLVCSKIAIPPSQ